MQRTPATEVISISSFSGADRFSYWADVVTQTFVPLQCDTPDRAGFLGDLRHRQIGSIGISEVRASGMQARRTAATIARAPRDDLIVVLQLAGTCHAEQNAAAARLEPGEGAVVTTDQCYSFEFPRDFRQLVLKIPRRLVAGNPNGAARKRSLLLAAGPSRLLQMLALSSLKEPIEFSTSEEIGIERAFAELLCSASPSSEKEREPSDETVRYETACQFIRRQLADPALNPSAVAAHVGMSTRNLARFFARRGTTIEQSIWSERLHAARRDLIDPRLQDSSVTEIAFSWAFNDAAHFSRRFSKAYGLAPTAYRAANLPYPLERPGRRR
jgi:AraC-like DNA-binding protein